MANSDLVKFIVINFLQMEIEFSEKEIKNSDSPVNGETHTLLQVL